MRKIVIELPDDVYAEACVEVERNVHPNQDYRWVRILRSIVNGIPLPKGHGRLIDADAATKTVQTFEDAFCACYSSTGGVTIACTAPTIIEADEEVNDG